MKRFALTAAALALAAAAHAATANEKLLSRHLASFVAGDLEALVSDYAADAVLVAPDATYVGPQQIHEFFRKFVARFPKGRSNLTIDRTAFHEELVYFTWHARTPVLNVPFATDTMVIRDGKIARQTFGGELQPLNE